MNLFINFSRLLHLSVNSFPYDHNYNCNTLGELFFFFFEGTHFLICDLFTSIVLSQEFAHNFMVSL